ncbi:protein ACCELERATED CELL DEATH 6-like [Bidens hawaiensis]|uniref:protein ACCELERATED CELL DEATH 6-like n=1 Tax=Bidens hawaiensis TaxID=980011 RepID=UPI004049AA4D
MQQQQQLVELKIEMETETSMDTTDHPLNHQPPEVDLEDIKTETPPSNVPNSEPALLRTVTSSNSNLNLPDPKYLIGGREEYLSICVPLYEASIKGNWAAAENIIRQHQEVKRCSITGNNETALHIAASAKSTNLIEDFVSKLVLLMEPEELKLKNESGNTALCLAAAGGTVSIARILVSRCEDLLNIPGSLGMLPLYIASLCGKYDMVDYLYQNSNNMTGAFWTEKNSGWVLMRCVEAEFFDIAVRIVKNRPELAINGDVLRALAKKTNAFEEIKLHFIRRAINKIIHVVERERLAIQLLRDIWNAIVRKSKKEIDDILRGPPDKEPQNDKATTSKHVKKNTHSSRVLFIAAEMGNTRFLVELIRQYPDLIWKLNDSGQSIFHVAVSHRQEGVYNLMYEIGSMKDFLTPIRDVDGNNMLHLAAKSAKKKRLQETSGVALQMQRELLWYKEVEGMLPPSCQEKKNNDGLLPHELFTNEHKDLMIASEKWMKNTASHCMVVAALIATVVFAAAFTVPGGYNNSSGIPILRNHRAFIVFVISDAISLSFATISILMFLYILTSRYAEEDFLESLPKKLMRGLAALFLSITAMMVAFSVSFFALYHNELIWVPTLISAFASMPVILYARLQYGLLADVYSSTYGSKNLFKPKKPMLY